MRRIKFILPIVALLAIFLAACGSDDKKSTTTVATTAPAATTVSASAATATPAKPALTGNITVFAAASLTDSFNEMATAFKAANPGVNVTFNFAGSPVLRTQLEQGARADIYASADTVQ